MSQPATAGAGLRDVAAAPSSICFIDGEQGILSYRGYNIHDLATHCNFEEVIYLLWHDKLPKPNSNNVMPRIKRTFRGSRGNGVRCRAAGCAV